MKTLLLNTKAALLTIAILFSMGNAVMATSYTASFNSNWSNASGWSGSNPGFTIGTGDNIYIPSGVTLVLDSDLTINGTITLNGGNLNLNGKNLTVGGAIITTGLGSIIGNKNSDITFNGYGGAGNMVFSATNQLINNLTINIGANSGVFLGSGLTVDGTLTLTKGTIGIGNNNLTISEKGRVVGGSSASYLINIGNGSLIMSIPNSGTTSIFQVGTQNGYASVAITNNSGTTGNFAVHAVEGVFAGGFTGSYLGGDQNMVNTSWNVSSSITSELNVNLKMSWNTGMQTNGFNNTEACVSQYTNTGWNTSQFSTATENNDGSFSLEMSGATSLSQFAVFGKNTTTAINQVTGVVSLILYPNPAANYINLSLAQTDNYPALKIFDVTGNEVMFQQIESNLTSLDITGLSKGVYFVSLNGIVAQKFVKE